MIDIDKYINDFKLAFSSVNQRESEMDKVINNQRELKELISNAKQKLDSWVNVSPSDGVSEAMADRQSSRDLSNQIEDAKELLKVLAVDEECKLLDVAMAHKGLQNARKELGDYFVILVNSEISTRIENTADKLRPHIVGLAELAVIKKIAGDEEVAIAWATAEFIKLLKPAMDNVDVNSVGVRIDAAQVMKERPNYKSYHSRLVEASGPAFAHKVKHMKNRK